MSGARAIRHFVSLARLEHDPVPLSWRGCGLPCCLYDRPLGHTNPLLVVQGDVKHLSLKPSAFPQRIRDLYETHFHRGGYRFGKRTQHALAHDQSAICIESECCRVGNAVSHRFDPHVYVLGRAKVSVGSDVFGDVEEQLDPFSVVNSRDRPSPDQVSGVGHPLIEEHLRDRVIHEVLQMREGSEELEYQRMNVLSAGLVADGHGGEATHSPQPELVVSHA
ncbi:DNA methylase [Mycobacterium phage prophi91-4]|nr:DNA methylase [Mycobacterium phage prophi91-4]